MKKLTFIVTTALGLILSPGAQGQDAGAAPPAPDEQESLVIARDQAQQAQQEVKRAMEQAQSQIDQVQRMKQQIAATGDLAPLPPMPEIAYAMAGSAGRPGIDANRPLVVRTSSGNGPATAQLEEDLTVMAHLLDKALDEVPGRSGHSGGGMRVMGIDIFQNSGASSFHSLYLDGYGAVFLLEVGFPLVPPSTKSPSEKAAGDSAWEEARQELYGAHQGFRTRLLPTEEFSQEKVDKLKSALLDALQNASNIRDLKPNDTLTLCVSGGPGNGSTRARTVVKAGVAEGGSGRGRWTVNHNRTSGGTVMTLKTKKADIDALAKGELKPEDFRQRVQINAYQTGGESGNGESAASSGSGL